MAISQRSLTELTSLTSSDFGAVRGAEISQVLCALLHFPTFCLSTTSLEKLKCALNNIKIQISVSLYFHIISN